MRGRKPKTDRLRLIDERERVIGGTEPPTAPAWLEGEAKEEFDRIVGELSRQYLITPLDAVSLASYCRMFALWRDADRTVAKEGQFFVSDNGNIRLHPAAKQCLALFEAMRRMGAEYGFTPAARSRLDAPKPETKEEDEFETFLETRCNPPAG